MKKNDVAWQGSGLVQTYLEGVRGAIPHANEQIEIMLRLIRAACPTVQTVLDLGCGDGILGRAVMDEYPAAHAVFVDFSEPMLAAARERLSSLPNKTIIALDYGDEHWAAELQEIVARQSSIGNIEFDVIVSGFSIHHQPDTRKKEVYAELYDLLKPGGIFVNIEHVASADSWIEHVFQDLFVDRLYDYQQRNGSAMSREEVDRTYYSRPDKEANILAPVENQCDWLRDIGFDHVDCYLKIFELAVFGGVKPILR